MTHSREYCTIQLRAIEYQLRACYRNPIARGRLMYWRRVWTDRLKEAA